MNIETFVAGYGPVVIFDVETTGVNVREDRIIQFGAVRYDLDEFGNLVEVRLDLFMNPEMPIPEAATAVHHITDAQVADEPKFKHYAGKIKELLLGAIIITYNGNNFDIPILETEFASAGYETTWLTQAPSLDCYKFFKRDMPHTLNSAHRFYTGEDDLPGNAHDAFDDVLTTIDVFEGQLACLEDPSPKAFQAACTDVSWVDDDGKLVWNAAGRACFTFGKHKGLSLDAVVRKHRTYLRWILGQTFSQDFKDIIADALDGKMPVRDETA